MIDERPVRPLVEAWLHYRTTRMRAHAGESELQAREDAFLHGGRAVFAILYALTVHAEDLDQVSLVLEHLGAELGFDERNTTSLLDSDLPSKN
jgi:hypothetical protein